MPKPRLRRPATASAATFALLAVLLSGCTSDTGAAAAEPRATAATPGSSATPPAPAESPSGPAAELPSGTVNIAVSDTSFSPGDLTASVGDTITVTNTGQLEHSWTSDEASIDSGVLPPGESFTFTVETAGTFTFHCTVHPEMTGTITIND